MHKQSGLNREVNISSQASVYQAANNSYFNNNNNNQDSIEKCEADQPEYSPHRNNNNNDHLNSDCSQNGLLQELAGNRRKDSAIEQSEEVK